MHDERINLPDSIMKSYKDHITRKTALKFLGYTFVFNTLIAVFLTAIKFGAGFVINFTISQSIGLSICTCMVIAHRFFDRAGPFLKAVLVAAALIVGSMFGSYVGSFLSGLSPAVLFEKHSLFQLLFLGVMFGAIITYFFSSRELLAESRAQIQEEKIKRLTSEKKAAEANLKLLQAQIEPHFLFNTLSNVLSLLDTNPKMGKSMLIDFIQYLRASLTEIRGHTVTLEQELAMIHAYLKIFKVRMGDRLKYTIDLPEHMQTTPFPPMLIQPLVENAIKHGLEPRVEGGEIIVRGIEKNGHLRLEVIDTGVGFSGQRDSGVGLTNIRERLTSLYGSSGRLILEANSPRGFRAIIEVPYGQT
jgi:sensor histidine kinase YesM